jgi:TolA-binding protein
MSYVRKRKTAPKKATPEEIISQQDMLQDWARKNSNLLIYGVGAIIFIAVISFGIIYVKGNKLQAATEALSEAQALYSLSQSLPAGTPDAANETGMPVPDELSREQALTAFLEVADKYGSLTQGKSAAVYAAEIQYEKGDYQAAVNTLESLLSSSPRFASAMKATYLLAASYEAMEDYPQAVGTYSQVLDGADGPFRAVVMLDMARCYELQGENDRARNFLENVSADFPDTNYSLKAEKKLAILARGSQ